MAAGTRFTALFVGAAQVGSVLVAAGLLVALDQTGWEWAQRVAGTIVLERLTGRPGRVSDLTVNSDKRAVATVAACAKYDYVISPVSPTSLCQDWAMPASTATRAE